MLAAFTTPALFWAGAAAVAAPILIHLLARRRFRRIRWAAMRFIVDAEKRNKRRVRIEEMILLALRCLAVLLIGLLVARPFLAPGAEDSLLGAGQPGERVILVDDSYSMGYLSDGQTAFARAKAAASNIVQRLREQAPRDTVTILRTSRLDSPVTAHAELDEQTIEETLARIEALEPSERGLSVDASLSAVAEQLDRAADASSAVVYILSDFQRIDWVDRAGGENASLAEPLANWARNDKQVRVVLVDVGDDAAVNLAISGLRPVHPQVVAGTEGPMEISVGNFGPDTAEAVDVQLAAGSAALASTRVDKVPPRGGAAAAVPITFPHPGDATVRAEIAADNLTADNVRYAAVEVKEAVRVLLVNGEPSDDPYNDEVHLLETALQPGGEVPSGNKVDTILEIDLESTRLDQYDLVVLCNLYRVSEAAADALRKYVANGGGLAIFLGDQVVDPLAYNAVLYRDGQGLLPASLETIVNAGPQGVSLAASDFLHPVVRVFSGPQNPFVQRVRFSSYFALDPAEADEKGTSLISDDRESPKSVMSPFRRPAANVIARFADDRGSPAIVERPYGRGRVMLFASSCDLEWNNWAKDPSYVVAMLEIVQYLSRTAGDIRAAFVGDPLKLDVDAADYELDATLRPPGFPAQQEAKISATATEGGMQFVWPHTDRAGVYTFVLHKRNGEEVTRHFAVNLDTTESDLSPAGPEELHRALAGVPVEYVRGVSDAADSTDQGRQEMWPLFLALAMGVLMLEQFLAWRFGRA